MLIGINAGFGDPIAADLPLLEHLGFDVVREDIRSHRSDADVQELLTEFLGRPIALLVLLGGGHIERPDGGRVEPHELAAHAARVWRMARDIGLPDLRFEVGNEPDLAHEGYRTRPQDFATAIQQTRDALRGGGFRGDIITGGIANLSTANLQYLDRMLRAGLPDDVIVGFHRYPRGMDPEKPHRQFRSREAEWDALIGLAGKRPVACTEFGHHTAPRRYRIFFKKRVTDAQVADHVEYDLDFFERHGCVLAAVYQLNDGGRDIAVDRYGIRRTDRTLKEVAFRIRERERVERAQLAGG